MSHTTPPSRGNPFAALRRVVLVFSSVALSGCLDMTGLGELSELISGKLIGISVTPSVSIVVGDTARLEATGQISGLMVILGAYDVLPDAEWNISNPTIARLEQVEPPAVDSYPGARIRLRGLRVGQATVSVSARGQTGTTEVIVLPPGAER
jgi:hypothetical protein